jgi:RelA/SpoT family (p)ppGpp synthetase
MQSQNIEFSDIYDITAFRVIVNTIPECYEVLGIVHNLWTPIPGKFKDYIALPKSNLYQSLHTTVIGPKGERIEIQIRTHEMHEVAEKGIAAHWKYKMGDSTVNVDWLKNLQYQNESIEEFYELVKNDLYSEDISVFTPAGDQVSLPRGATVLDFAYAVHTQVGERASGALVNKRPASLLTELKNGDLVRIVTADEPIYHCTWIDAVKTSRAKNHMKTRCNQRRKVIDRRSAVNLLADMLKVRPSEVETWAEAEGIEGQLYRVARDLRYFKEVLHRMYRAKQARSKLPGFLQFPGRRLKRYVFENFIIHAVDTITSVEFDYCCHPKRNDPILAFREGNKAIVHHKFCEKAYERIVRHAPMLFVEWKEDRLVRYRVLVTLKDEKGELARLLAFLAKLDINVMSIRLGDGLVQSNLCELVIESREYDGTKLRSLIERRFKVIELVNQNDAYKQTL